MLTTLTLSILSVLTGLQSSPLASHAPIVVPGKAGGFDYMAVDNKKRRVFASHSKVGTFTVFELTTGKVHEIATGEVNGIAIDEKDNLVLVGGGGQHVLSLNRDTLAKVKDLKVDGPGDDIELDTKRDKLYVCHDDGTEDWVVNPKTMKLLGSIKVEEAPEFVVYSPKMDRIYQNIKSTDHLQVIDPAKDKVIASWNTAPMSKPHGLAIDEKTNRIFSVGSNGKMLVMDLKNGKILQVIDVKTGVDQIVFDPGNRRVYCAGRGFISVVQESASGSAKLLADVPSPAGAHTITVDPKTHDVWICYADAKSSYLQRFSVK